MINQTCKPNVALTIALLIAMGFCNLVQSQTPTVTVRLANPSYSCQTGLYCLDVEFQADAPNVQLFGMNVRFFYPDAIMELNGFSDFQGGYGPVSPNPPTIIQSAAGFGTTFFGFPAPGIADWVNGAIQLVDANQPAIILGTNTWTKLFQICFTVEGPIADSTNFCPPIVWDLELNPANGGYLAGDDGVVMTVVAPPPAMSAPANENVVQYNWMYTGDGSAAPYGTPNPTSCISIACVPTIVTVELDNPTYDCETGLYCLDVLFRANVPDISLFGMNVRFFYPDAIMELDGFTDFQGGYGPVSPDPPTVIQSGPGFGTTFFGFPAPGVTDFVNGAIQLVDNMAPPIVLDTVIWTKLFQICFTLDGPIPDSSNFCPPVVWDLELIPANGGYLAGDDGVVMTIVAPPPAMSEATVENVLQYNWMYTGDGSAPPYGAPNPTSCISLLCQPDIACPADVTIYCGDSVDPAFTGTATATEECISPITIVYSDITSSVPQGCIQDYLITRTWIAFNECSAADTCVQLIVVTDTLGPVINCPADITIECDESTDPSNTGMATATDLCDPTPEVIYIDITVAGACPQEYTIDRIWIASDTCGNINLPLCRQEITIRDVTPPAILCPADLTLECTDPIPTDSATATDNCSTIITYGYTDILCDNPVMGFDGVYDFANWTIITPSGGSVIPMGDEVMLESPDGNMPCPNGASVLFQIVIPSTGQIVFDWNYISSDVDGPFYDPFGYRLNGIFYQLTDDNGGLVQSGVASVTVAAGDIFAFEQNSIDCIFGEGATTVVEFFACVQQAADICTQLIIRDHTATDECGNQSNCVQTIFIQDTTAPILTCATQVTPLSCPAVPVFTPPTVTDACDATVTVTFADATTPGSCAGTYSVTRTWTASDNCGNTSTCSSTVVVQDIMAPTITCVAQTTPVTCPAVPVFIPPTATDACDATVAITFTDATTQGSCAGSYSVTRTWTATDDCGNTATCSGTIAVQDITPPTITCVAQTTPINCPALPVFIPPTATDACDATVTITFTDATTQGSCAGTYSVTRTWTATDDCGNTATCSGTIAVQDITPPTITCIAQTTPINCPTLPVFTPPTATDACDATVTITFVDATTQGTCVGTYSVTRTWTATDDCGNTASCSGTIAVQDITPPTITCVAQTTPINCPAVPVFTPPTVTDACDATVTITFTDATTQGSCAGTYSVTRTWTATDDCGNTATCSGTIVVLDNTPPTITCVAQTTPINCPALPVFIPPTATDACDATVTITFTDATTQGTCAGTYSVTRTWTATDDCGNTATCSGTIMVQDITPPTITCATQTTPVNCPAVPVFLPPTATDACDATVTITFTDATTQGTCAGTYSLTRTWTATDDCGNTATCSGTIVVQDITPPTITCVAQTTPINCPAVPVFIPPTATDACDATVTITFTDATTQGSCAGTYSVTRTWTATDDCGNTATCSGTIVVQDFTPPTITCVAQTTPVNCPALPVFTPPTATDACDATVAITFTDGTTQGTCAGTYTVTRTWTATDDCGNTATCSGTIVVQDITPPTITCVAQTTPVNCQVLPVFTPPTATDACDATVTITFIDATTPGSCAGTYSVTRTWTATDDCGNTATCSGTIVVVDITPPTITCAVQTTPINCPAVPVFTPPTATDVCDATVTITFTDATTPGSCAGTYSVTRTWTATDDCGNTASCSGTIVVQDNTPPTITCATQTTPISCPAVPVFLPPTATDACDATVAISFTDATTQGTCAGTYSVTRTWTATDDCGNTATCSGTIAVQDITPPTITCVAQTTPINCPAVPVFIPPTATDACDATVTITFVDATTPGSCVGTYSVTRTWTATDDCGNTATCSGTIVVQDNTPPTITCVAQTTPISCPAVPVFIPPTATDACDATVAITFVDATTPGSCTGTYSVSRTWTATDDCGNTATCSGTIVVIDNTPPTITCVTQTSPVFCLTTPAFIPPTATDACDATVTITFTDAITPGSCPAAFSVTRTWTATDDCGNTATCSGTVVVVDITPPVITCAVQTTPINCPAVPVFTPPTATDACDATVTITFTDATTPGSCAGTYSVTRTWTATDDCGNTASCSGTIVVQDNTPPTITCATQTTPISCPAVPVFIPPTATDACDATVAISFTDATTQGTCAGTYSVTRTWTATDDCGNTATCSGTIAVQDITPPTITCVAQTTPINCPAVPVFIPPTATDACDATVTITFVDATTPGSCVGTYSVTRTWTATDDCGNTATCSGTIVVQDNTPPTITCVAQTTPVSCPAVPVFNPPTATDACDATVTITFVDATTPGTCTGTYSVTRTWTATDDCGNTAACTGTIVVIDNTPPTITCGTQNSPNNCLTTPAFIPPTATDACDATVTITFADAITPGSCPAAFSVTRTWTATDDCGNTATCSGTIVVVDITPPVITCAVQTTPINCPAVPVFNPPTTTDACDASVTVTFVDATAQGSCPGTYSVTRTWTATDDCGNSASCSSTIDVIDNTPPTLTCATQNTPINCPAVPEFIPPSATDACDTEVDVSFTDVTVQGTCSGTYSVTRTWIAGDDCGNTSSCSSTIVVQDITPPTITCVAQTTPLNCPAVPVFIPPTATDECSVSVTITFADVTTPGSCPASYSVTRTWSATDQCGNTSTCSGTIVVQDIVPPAITCPQGVTVSCASEVPPVLTGGVTVSDNCSSITVTHDGDVITNQTCVNRFTLTRTYRATDACGNSATCAQVITVFDQTPPTIACPAPVTVSCASQVPAVNTGSVTASDNCTGSVTVTHVGDVITNQTCVNRFTLTRTYLATDACGNSATCSQIITVNDQTPPSITCPAPVTVMCASQVPAINPGSVIASDNCAGGATVTHVGDVITNQTCANRFTLTRTYLATDACGNSATCSQVITVFDNTAPVITCPPNITIAFGADTNPVNTGSPTGTDNCGGTPTFTFTSTTIPGICATEFTINRTWTATDACGNTATCLQVIFVDGQCIVDLSLTKVLIDAGPVEGGDNVDFIITVTNEGEVSAGSITITDYIPIGFMLNDPDWTPGNAGSTGQSASIVLSIANGGLDANGLNPGESVVVIITLRANDDIQPGVYVNTAEITFVRDVNGVDITNQDIDSDPDANDTNDPPGEDDIDQAQICVLPHTSIAGDGFVCPGETSIYSVVDYNPDFTYVWTLNGGGVIVDDNGSDIAIEWGDTPGGPFQITLTIILGQGCQTTYIFFVYIQGVDPLACNDQIQISLDENCQAVVLSGMILEGEVEGNNNYFVVLTDDDGNVIPNATLTSEHIGQCFTAMVVNECNGQSCWGRICVEDKIPPVIECNDVTLSCGTSLDPIYEPLVTGNAIGSVNPGSSIGPNAGDITLTDLVLALPNNAIVTDVNVTVDLTHTWSGDLDVVLISPAGTEVVLATAICGSADNWDNVTFDDQAGISVTNACNNAPPPALLSGSVIPQELLGVINAEGAGGTWTLRITDLANADGGTLNLFGLNVAYYLAAPNAPAASDACGEVNLTYTDSQTGEDCEDLILTRTWTATDGSGNTATCIQTITIIPLTLDNITFPAAYIGQCGESIFPENTGWPTVDGYPITDENNICNIFVGYWDKELNECGGGRKIVRTWTILDWCTVETVEAVQVIKLQDTEGPELTCPQDFEVGTDFWYCYANVSVPKPVAQDDCSEVTSYILSSSSGTVVSFGNNFVINGLGLGVHTVTWTVADECGNRTSCTFHITVVDDVVPVANCDAHTIVALTNDGPKGITLVPASTFDDGSYDNCGPVTFRARRMDSCIDFDWTTEGACIDDTPGGIPPVNSRDRGTVHRPCVPFACCDVGAGPIMVELEVTDASGNVNYCMIEATVQDKISPFVECPPDIIVSCDFWFNVQEGTFVDGEGNNNGSLDEDPLSQVFGNMYDAFRYDESIRQNIIINDPSNDDYHPQPHFWGIDGWADDNCEVNLQVRVRVVDDCSGGDLPGNAPDGAVKYIERRFSASDGNDGVAPGTCTQRIWVVDYDPFYITDVTCNNANPQDGVIWPCDVLLTTCPEDLGNLGQPTIFDDACSLIGVTYEDTRFDFVDGACYKILRRWAVIDWCQYNSQTGEGLWYYTQVIKVHDEDGPEFVDPCETVTLCVADDGVSLPDNNQAFLGEDNPLSSSCSVHLNLSRVVHETCSDIVHYDVKIYPFNGTDYILIKPTTAAGVDSLTNDATLSFDTRQSTIQSVRLNGIPYNSQWCGDYHRILWSVEDGCGNWSHCEYLFRLEDCKQPSPVCINGLSTVVMPVGGQVTVWAKDFNASSFDDCTPEAELLYSFSGDTYTPSYTYTCDNVPAFNVEIATQIWVADNGTDDNCNGTIQWSERNKDYCTTSIVITDNAGVCEGSGSILAGNVLTDFTHPIAQVNVTLTSPGHLFPQFITSQDGKFEFKNVPLGNDYVIGTERNDNHKNGVSTLDLVRIQKHLLGKELFTTPYQYIAADANNSQSVSAIDLIEIRKLILGIYTEFPLNKSWRFVQEGYQMNLENPWPFNEIIQIPALANDSVMHNDFVGVKIGDVNNTAKANANQILPRNGRRVLHVELEGVSNIKTSDVVEVKLRIPESVEGFQWTLETEGLTFEGVSSETMNLNDSHIGLLKDGVITMSWNAEATQTVVPGQIVSMRFIATASGNLEDMIQLTSRITEAEAYTPEGEILDVKLGHTDTGAEFALYQNNPNPWNMNTTIGFDLPADAAVKLTVFDVTGKAVKLIEGNFKAGYNTITLAVADLPSTGVMYYRLDSGEYSASKKMVLIK